VCHGIAQQAANQKGGPDLAFAQCVKSEQAMRQKLVGEWSTFFAGGKDQLYRIGSRWIGKLHRPRHLSRNGERREAAQSKQVKYHGNLPAPLTVKICPPCTVTATA